MILSLCVDATKGVLRTRVTDDQTSWWIEVREETGVTAGNVEEFFRRKAEARLTRYHGLVQTSEGDAIEFDVPWSKEKSNADPWWPIPEMAKIAVEKGREKGHLSRLPAGVLAHHVRTASTMFQNVMRAQMKMPATNAHSLRLHRPIAATNNSIPANRMPRAVERSPRKKAARRTSVVSRN
ncbi:MAG TPA: hypothetical protein VHR45_15370 [Thermoanaerobaculia bacterium]|nr:hypothetical protein [Thermoanaerobaculia bacterium]